MVKSTISILCVLVVIMFGVIYESNFIHRQFNEFNEVLTVLYEKTENESATEADVIAVRDNWKDKKKYLHIFIPHNEIKEIDLWVSESVKLVKDKKWTDAISKIEVLLELSKEIPKTFSLRIENIL